MAIDINAKYQARLKKMEEERNNKTDNTYVFIRGKNVSAKDIETIKRLSKEVFREKSLTHGQL